METSDLRKAGLKITLPRLKILEILGTATPRHMSAEDIYKHLLESHEDIGLATVYRVLTQFEAAGLVTRHHFEGTTAVFELNEGEHHDHIVCLDCGKVEEFMDAGIEDRQRTIAARHQFEIKDGAQVRLLTEDVALVAYQVREEMTVEGKPLTLNAADASVWVRRNGEWKCALHTESIAGDGFGRDRKGQAA